MYNSHSEVVSEYKTDVRDVEVKALSKLKVDSDPNSEKR